MYWFWACCLLLVFVRKVLGFVFGKADICYNASILTEYREVLMRSKFGFNEKRVEEIVFL